MSKIICHDYYGNVVTSLTQWDTNRVLKIHNWQYDVSPIIQWTNRSETESYEVESILNQDGTVTFEVPNALLQNTETAIVFIGVARNGENGSSDIENATVFKVEFPIQRRTKPSGYVYSDNATVVDIVALKEVLENQIESKIDATRTDLSAEITSALHTTLDSVKDGAPKATFENQEDLVGKEPGIYLYHHTLGSTDPMAKYDGYVFYWDGEKLSEPLISYGGKDSQANIAVTLIKPSTGEQFLEITVTDKDGNENVITTDNLNGKEGIKKIIYNGSELAVSDDKTVEFNAQPYIEELDFINDESEIEKLTIGKLYIVKKEMDIDGFTYYPGSLIIKTSFDNIVGIGDSGFVFNGEVFPLWSEIQNLISFKKTQSGYEFIINNEKIKINFPKTSELQNDSGYITADDAPPEVYVGPSEPKGNELIWVDNSTNPENINATKAYVDSIFKHKYSTDEQVVGTWIDGKPIYERVLHYDTISQSGAVTMYYYNKDGNQITIPIERIINMNGSFVLNGAGQNPRSCEPIPRIQSYWSFTADWFQEDKFMCTIDSNFNQFSGGISDVNITIRYTKTTDAIPQDVTE